MNKQINCHGCILIDEMNATDSLPKNKQMHEMRKNEVYRNTEVKKETKHKGFLI